MGSRDARVKGVLILAVLVGAPFGFVAADEPSKPTGPALRASEHPLSWTLRYATAQHDFIRRSVRDYSCLLIKRERIAGELQEYQYLRTQVRREQTRDGVVVRPMAVFMQYAAPKRLKGRRILFVEGKHGGKVLVRKGGVAFGYLKLKIDPHGAAARRESNYPITDVGFGKMVQRLIVRIKSDIKHDPQGTNTRVSYFQKAKVNDRSCLHIRVVHPERGEGLDFHTASLYVDDELQVPIRVVVHGWPRNEADEPPLIEEYTYVKLRLNVGLSDADFSPSRLDSIRGTPRPAIPASLPR